MRRWLIAAVIGAQGCSWMTVATLPSHHQPGDAPACSDNSAPVIVDALFTGLGVLVWLGAIATVTSEDVVYESEGERTGALVGANIGGAIVTVPFLLSALYGKKHTARCRQALLRYVKY